MSFNYKKFGVVSLLAASLFASSCSKDYLETRPSSSISTGDITSTTQGLYTLLNGLHYHFVRPGASGGTRAYDWGQKSVDMGLDIMGEDIVLSASPYDWFTYHYQYVSTEAANYWMPAHIWLFYYRIINNANQILAAVDNASGPSNEKQDLKGQALTYRAYAYFRLVNCFSEHILAPGGPTSLGVPIYTQPTEGNTIFQGRGTVQDVYNRIFADLDEAELLLYTSGIGTTPVNKSHISLDVYNGIYARVALTAGQYEKAAMKAMNAKDGHPLMNAAQLLQGFNSSLNDEWMWASQLTAEQSNARGLLCFMSWMDEEAPGYANVGAVRAITETLYNLIDPDDIRKSHWNDADFLKQKKFGVVVKTGFDYNDLLMRSSEMYLIEAEAAARMGDNARAANVLQELMVVRNPSYDVNASVTAHNDSLRAKRLLGLTNSDNWTILEEIKLQRKIELWGEGFGYEDVRRYQKGLNRPRNYGKDHSPGRATVITLLPNAKQFLFRIPQSEIDANSNVQQNP